MKNVIIFFFFLVASIFPQIDSAVITGFGSMNVPMSKDKKFDLDYMRIQVCGFPSSVKNLSITARYDIACNKMNLAYVNYAIPDYMGYAISIYAGRFLGPTGNLFEAPHTMEALRYPLLISNNLVVYDGIGLSVGRDGYVVRTAIFDAKDKKSFSGSFDSKNISFYFIEGKALGVILKNNFTDYLNVFAGAQRDEQTDKNLFFVRNKVSILSNLSLYGEIDFLSKKEVYPLVGMTYSYSKYSYIKLYLDRKEKAAISKVTFYF